MVFYTIVELLNAGPEDYAKLDGHMALAGFARIARSKAGEPYRLPHGVYRSQSRYHASEVMAIARGAANSTGCKNEVMTIEATAARWFSNVDATPVEPERDAVTPP